ncbi:GIY-YIG nuclease family protein [Neisseriaceae bacterium TC5R-5]|nr:GIY-YIG nuclease family protein [Neisseriaceae bacterium TC5R-5]
MPKSPPAKPGSNKPWFVYVLRCSNGALYTGITTDVTRRYAQHCAGKGARYTRLNPPLNIAQIWECENRSRALQMEYAFKQLSSQAKQSFLQQQR